MTITRSGKVVNNEGGLAPQNVGAGVAQLLMDEVRLMMQNMLDQQRRVFMELLIQGIDNARGGIPVINEPIVIERINHGLVPSHATTVQEGNNNDLESYQGLEQPKVRMNVEPIGHCKYKDFMTCKPSSFNGKEDPNGVICVKLLL